MARVHRGSSPFCCCQWFNLLVIRRVSCWQAGSISTTSASAAWKKPFEASEGCRHPESIVLQIWIQGSAINILVCLCRRPWEKLRTRAYLHRFSTFPELRKLIAHLISCWGQPKAYLRKRWKLLSDGARYWRAYDVARGAITAFPTTSGIPDSALPV